MARSSRGARVLVVLVSLTLMLSSVGFSYAIADDYSRRLVLPRGAAIGGIEVGGLRRDRAVALLERELERPLLQPLSAEARGKRYELDPRKLVSIDVEGMVDRALAPRERTTLVERVYLRATNAATGMTIPAEVRLDHDGLRAWTAGTAKAVYEEPRDSKLSVDGDRLRISKSEVGWRLDESATVGVLQAALTTGKHEAALPMLQVKPRVTEASFRRTILVRLSKRHLFLFEGTRPVKDYPIAVGMAAYPTPKGWWRVMSKQVNPTWTNPGSAWAAGMPASIPGGPGNPLGTRAIRLDASGVAIHGTSASGSIGTAASHGCMRMHMRDVEDLYPRVAVGDRVIVAP